MREMGKWFYIILLILTVVVLGCVTAWSWTKHDAAMIAMLVSFAIYLAYLITSMARSKSSAKKDEELISQFFLTLGNVTEQALELNCYCAAKHVLKPRERKHDFYIAFYPLGEEALVKALQEGKAEELTVDSFALPCSVLPKIKHVKFALHQQLYDLLQQAEYYQAFLENNTFYPYG